MNPVRSLARAKGASPKDLGGATSYGMNLRLINTNWHYHSTFSRERGLS